MKTVNVATLKQKLSEYLRVVEQGDEVMVTSHRRQIARLVPEHGMELAVRRPTQPMSALLKIRGVKPSRGFSAVRTLLCDRRRR